MDVGAKGHKWVLVKVFTREKCYPSPTPNLYPLLLDFLKTHFGRVYVLQ